MITLPPGFTAVPLTVLLAPNPQLKDLLVEHLKKADVSSLTMLYDLTVLEQKGLIKFAISPDGQPGMFTAARGRAASDKEQKFLDILVEFWDTKGEYNPDTGLVVVPRKPTLPYYPVPHWQRALDQKFKAIDSLRVLEKLNPEDYPEIAPSLKWMDLQEDLDALRLSEVYSFNAETMHAIMAGAKTVSHEATLQSVEVPRVKAGWFWFAEPFPVSSSPLLSDFTQALLWSWVDYKGTPAIRFSAYTKDEKQAGTPVSHTDEILPSTKWQWPIDLSFHEMLAYNTVSYKVAYGVGGPYHDQPHLMGQEKTLKVIAELSLYFLMTCLWFRQTVPGTGKKMDPKLTQEFGHIERHARKRMQKEAKLDAPPTVRVIALRKSTVMERDPSTPVGEGRHLTVRFVVSGHARLQACGPGRKDHKLIWIDPYPKGPEDAPFKPPSERVFAVVR